MSSIFDISIIEEKGEIYINSPQSMVTPKQFTRDRTKKLRQVRLKKTKMLRPGVYIIIPQHLYFLSK